MSVLKNFSQSVTLQYRRDARRGRAPSERPFGFICVVRGLLESTVLVSRLFSNVCTTRHTHKAHRLSTAARSPDVENGDALLDVGALLRPEGEHRVEHGSIVAGKSSSIPRSGRTSEYRHSDSESPAPAPPPLPGSPAVDSRSTKAPLISRAAFAAAGAASSAGEASSTSL